MKKKFIILTIVSLFIVIAISNSVCASDLDKMDTKLVKENTNTVKVNTIQESYNNHKDSNVQSSASINDKSKKNSKIKDNKIQTSYKPNKKQVNNKKYSWRKLYIKPGTHMKKYATNKIKTSAGYCKGPGGRIIRKRPVNFLEIICYSKSVYFKQVKIFARNVKTGKVKACYMELGGEYGSHKYNCAIRLLPVCWDIRTAKIYYSKI